MPRDLVSLTDLVSLFAGGRPDPRINPVAVVNDAGEYVASMHEWTFLKRPPVTVDLVAGQAFITLPADVGRIDSIEATSAVLCGVTFTSMEVLNLRRASEVQELLHYHVAPEWPAPQDGASSPPPMRLALTPTPTETTSAAFRVAYTAGWRTLSTNRDRHVLPPDMEQLLVEVIKAMTMGMTEKRVEGGANPPTTIERLEVIARSSLVQGLKVRYGEQLGNLGKSRGGVLAATRHRRVPYRHHTAITMPADGD